jgi:hypothetical protein
MHLPDLVLNARLSVPGDADLEFDCVIAVFSGRTVYPLRFRFQTLAHHNLAGDVHGPVQDADAVFTGNGRDNRPGREKSEKDPK